MNVNIPPSKVEIIAFWKLFMDNQAMVTLYEQTGSAQILSFFGKAKQGIKTNMWREQPRDCLQYRLDPYSQL